MYICDSGPFFQKAFLAVIKPEDWPPGTITQEEYEDIKPGKEKRSSAHLGEEMMRYNRLENDILCRIMTLLDKAFRDIGINLKRINGLVQVRPHKNGLKAGHRRERK